jgi:hypothetical protein
MSSPDGINARLSSTSFGGGSRRLCCAPIPVLIGEIGCRSARRRRLITMCLTE